VLTPDHFASRDGSLYIVRDITPGQSDTLYILKVATTVEQLQMHSREVAVIARIN
jgi:serine/threonine protein kinase